MRFVYCYLMKGPQEQIIEAAPQHAAYWRSLDLTGYAGGPFEDRSGGLIIFETPGRAQAEQLVAGDPFRRRGLIHDWWLRVWLPQ
jgi:uncharacterized protein YciI